MDFEGKGNRKPQLDIDIKLLSVDKKNPRLAPYLANPDDATEIDLITVLYENFDTEAVALSLIQNGYFDEEPIIIVPQNIPSDFSFAKYTGRPDDLANSIEELIKKGLIDFTVVEGNRRTTAIKLITDKNLRKQLKIDAYYPKTSNAELISDITKIPCIIYEKRENVTSYLGVRHIAGLLKWEAFAQASYTAQIIDAEIENGKDITAAVKYLQKTVGDRSDKLRKQYVTYKLFQEAKSNLDFNVKPIVNKFSLLTVAYNSPSIREYIGVKRYSEVDLSSELVSSDKYEEFKNVLTWIYGDKDANIPPVLTDSRNITNNLSHVVKKPEAVEFLLKHKDLEGAYDRTSGEVEYLLKKITDANRAIGVSMQFAYKYKNNEQLLEAVEELEAITSALKTQLS